MERAEALRTSAAVLPERVQLAMATPRLSGISSKSTWRAEIVDMAVFVRYVAEHPEWIHLVEVNSAALNGLARSQKSALTIPGVKVVEEKQVAARTT
jgi:colicin import membrane protein